MLMATLDAKIDAEVLSTSIDTAQAAIVRQKASANLDIDLLGGDVQSWTVKGSKIHTVVREYRDIEMIVDPNDINDRVEFKTV
jgi:hypothetical protein